MKKNEAAKEEQSMRANFEYLQKITSVTSKNEKSIAESMKSIVESLVLSEKSSNGCYEYAVTQSIHRGKLPQRV